MQIAHDKSEDCDNKINYFRPAENPYGLSYGQWTVKWWQWAKSCPITINPVIDKTGKYAHVNQQGPVWFLAGTFVEKNIAHRTCTVPDGKAILFPVINYEMNPLEMPELVSGSDLIQHVTNDIDDIVVKDAIVDGTSVPVYRIKSDPLIFSLKISDENNSGIPGGMTYASADGYWVFLKPLLKGQHHIYFHGSCSGGQRSTAADYVIEVE
jgi:hypothetical protein